METTQTLPVTIVIFGASGDLTRRKLIPSLFNLYRKKTLPEYFQIVGYALDVWSDDQFRIHLHQGVTQFAEYAYQEAEWQAFEQHLTYQPGNFTQLSDFEQLAAHLAEVEQTAANRLYYLATPPMFFGPIVQNLGKVDMVEQKEGWRRVVIEKPFGANYQSAFELNAALHTVLQEDQIYRIDHYLGKETVQNLLVFRFANTIFEPVWNRHFIDNVQISVLEEVGVGHRAGYYEKAGVLRDMFQNHLLQLLTLIAIDPPNTLKHKDLHTRKLQLLKDIRPLQGEEVAKNSVRGQYVGYRDEPGVAPDSQTATYGALRLFIDNPCWKGVPFYLRSGKALDRKCTEIIVQFTCPPTAVFPLPPKEEITPNILAMCIQPDEGIYLRFEAKVPDTEADMRSVEMEFHYNESFGASSIPEAYERLILEAIQGDHTLFNQDDVTELSWKLFDPIIEAWEGPQAPPLHLYPQQSWGPKEADAMIAESSWEWMITCGMH